MTIEEAITKHLEQTAAVSAILVDRIYPQVLPQNPTYPALVYFVVSNPVTESHTGSSELAHPRFQLNAWSPDYLQAKSLARAVRRALQGFQGTMGGVGGVEVDAVLFEDGDGGSDVYDDDLEIHGVQMDCIVWHYDP